MPDPNALPQQPAQASPGLMDMILPTLVGLGSAAAGFGVGRSPGGDPSIFMQPLQTMSLLDYRNNLGKHYDQQAEHQRAQDVQAGYNRAVDVGKQMAEVGNAAGIEQMRGQLGPYYEGLHSNALQKQGLMRGMGFNLPQLGPGAPGFDAPAASPDTQAPPSAYRQKTTRSMNVGGMTMSQEMPGEQPNETLGRFIDDQIQKSGSYPTLDVLSRNMYLENQKRQQQGLPGLVWTKDAQDAYMSRMQVGNPTAWRQYMLQQKEVDMPAEVALRELQRQQRSVNGPVAPNPFVEQSAVDIGRAANKEAAVTDAREQVGRKFARLPETERTKLDQQDNVLRNAAAIIDMGPKIIAKYGARPGFMQSGLSQLEEEFGTQDPELAKFIRLQGELYTAARNRISGTAVGRGEEKALSTYLADPRGNPVTIMQAINSIFLATLDEEGRTLRRAQSYGGEDLTPYTYNKITKRRLAKQPLYPELSGDDPANTGGPSSQNIIRLKRGPDGKLIPQ